MQALARAFVALVAVKMASADPESESAPKAALASPAGLDVITPTGKKTNPAILAQRKLRSSYDRLVELAADMEKVKGDVVEFANLNANVKLKGNAARALEKDPELVSNIAQVLTKKAFHLVGKESPAFINEKVSGPEAAYTKAYRTLLSAAEGVELARRHAMELPPKKLAAFAAEAQKSPDEVEESEDTLEKDLEEAEAQVEKTGEEAKKAAGVLDGAEQKLAKAKGEEKKADANEDIQEAEAVNKEAKKELADADEHIGGGEEVVGVAKEDEVQVAEGKKAQEEAKAEEAAATEEHKAEKAEHEAADQAEEDAEAKVDDAKDAHVEAKEDHEEAQEAHEDAKEHHENVEDHKHHMSGELGKSGAWKNAAPLALVLMASLL